MSQPPAGQRDPLPLASRSLALASGVSTLGGGLLLPYLVLYLSRAQGLSDAAAGVAVAVLAGAGLTASLGAGTLVDRFGSRWLYLAGHVLGAVSSLLFLLADTVTIAFTVAAVAGIARSMRTAATATMVAAATPTLLRARAFALQHAAMNMGFGIGGIAGALIVDLDQPGTFVTVFVVDAITFLLAAPAAFVPGADVRHAAEPATPGPTGYRALLADRPAMLLIAVDVAVVAAVSAPMDVVLPIMVVDLLELQESWVGISYAVATGTVAAASLLVARTMPATARIPALVGGSLLMALSWLLVLAGALSPAAAAILLLAMAAANALGESVQAPAVSSLLNDFAPDRFRGRYNAAHSLGLGLALTIAPLPAGFLLHRGLGPQLVVGMVVVGAAAALAGLRLAPSASYHSDAADARP